MDGITLNFDHILLKFYADVIVSHWGHVQPSFKFKKKQMKVILIWINEEITPKLSIGSVHRVGRLPSFLATSKSFPSMIFVTHIPEWLFGYNVERIILKNPSGAVLWANIEVNLILNT